MYILVIKLNNIARERYLHFRVNFIGPVVLKLLKLYIFCICVATVFYQSSGGSGLTGAQGCDGGRRHARGGRAGIRASSGFNIKYNIWTLFVEQKKFCGVSVHTWPATSQASKY